MIIELSSDPKIMLVQESNDHDAVSMTGTWKILIVYSSASLFYERNTPQQMIIDNNNACMHYCIVFQLKDGTTTIKVGHYGLVQACLMT